MSQGLSWGETSDSNNFKTPLNEVYEKRPEFGEGMAAFYKFVAQNFKVPEVENLNGKIIVSFIVDEKIDKYFLRFE